MGSGCSKEATEPTTTTAEKPKTPPTEEPKKTIIWKQPTNPKMTKIAIIYYSLYGHLAGFSESIKKGIEAGGAECDIYQVAETLPEEVLKKMGAPPKKDHPVITTEKLL